MPRIRYSQNIKNQTVKLVLKDLLIITEAVRQIEYNPNTFHK